jgi:hypothetical protein
LGHELSSYRLVSLLFAVAGVLLIHLASRSGRGTARVPVAALLLALFPLHVAGSGFARPYTASVAVLLFGWLACRRVMLGHSAGHGFLATVAVGQLVHESGVLLALMPAACLVAHRPSEPCRRRMVWLLAVAAPFAGGLHLLLGRLQRASVEQVLGRSDGSLALSVVRGLALPPLDVPALAHWWVIALVGVPILAAVVAWLRRATGVPGGMLLAEAMAALLFQLGTIAALVGVACLARPQTWRSQLRAGLTLMALSALAWTTHSALITDAAPTAGFAWGLVESSLQWPLGWVGSVVSNLPLTTTCVAIACAASKAREPEGDTRAVALWWVLSLLLLGGLALAPQPRYLLVAVPAALLACADAVERAGALASRLAVGRGWRLGFARVAVPTVLVLALLLEHSVYGRTLAREDVDRQQTGWLDTYTPPTWYTNAGELDCLRSAGKVDTIVCNDELACALLLGRVDAWLLPDAGLRGLCSVSTVAGPRGLYAGSQVLPDVATFERLLQRHHDRPLTVVLLHPGKFGFVDQAALTRSLTDRHPHVTRTCGASGQVIRFSHPRRVDASRRRLDSPSKATLE